MGCRCWVDGGNELAHYCMHHLLVQSMGHRSKPSQGHGTQNGRTRIPSQAARLPSQFLTAAVILEAVIASPSQRCLEGTKHVRRCLAQLRADTKWSGWGLSTCSSVCSGEQGAHSNYSWRGRLEGREAGRSLLFLLAVLLCWKFLQAQVVASAL